VKPRLALSCGDPAGIGPELCCRVANDPELTERCDLVVLGPTALFERVARHCDLPMPPTIIESATSVDVADIVPGQVSEACGAIALAAINDGIDGCLDGRYQGLVTAPINKQAIAAAGSPHPGHTELLAERCRAESTAMALTAPGMTVALTTCHVPLGTAVSGIDSERIVEVAGLLHHNLRTVLGRPPRLAMLGLNPHAGEGGLLGREEELFIVPAIEQLRAGGIDCSDPLPPDTAFTASARERYDGWLCHYHDQGLIPFKALAFDEGVNWTLGLPIIRTSPDHGTAFDRAWQASARPDALASAIALAADLAETSKTSR
jgi:4-hydroxythreonine-4-phosphate dehydrogenase